MTNWIPLHDFRVAARTAEGRINRPAVAMLRDGSTVLDSHGQTHTLSDPTVLVHRDPPRTNIPAPPGAQAPAVESVGRGYRIEWVPVVVLNMSDARDTSVFGRFLDPSGFWHSTSFWVTADATPEVRLRAAIRAIEDFRHDAHEWEVLPTPGPARLKALPTGDAAVILAALESADGWIPAQRDYLA